jgi:hypothetical protein
MFFKRKNVFPTKEKILVVEKLITTDTSFRQLAKVHNIKESELSRWYQVYRYGIEQNLENQSKRRLIPLVTNSSNLPDDTFILFLNTDISELTGSFTALFHNEIDTLEFCKGKGAMIIDGDESILFDIKDTLQSLCPDLNDGHIVFAQIKDIELASII